MANRYIIIGRDSCPFCVMAEELCSASHLQSIFLNYSENPDILEDYKEFYKSKTVPIILENDLDSGITTIVGGYSDLLSRLREKDAEE